MLGTMISRTISIPFSFHLYAAENFSSEQKNLTTCNNSAGFYQIRLETPNRTRGIKKQKRSKAYNSNNNKVQRDMNFVNQLANKWLPSKPEILYNMFTL